MKVVKFFDYRGNDSGFLGRFETDFCDIGARAGKRNETTGISADRVVLGNIATCEIYESAGIAGKEIRGLKNLLK